MNLKHKLFSDMHYFNADILAEFEFNRYNRFVKTVSTIDWVN